MASKKVYFYEVKLFRHDNDNEVDYHELERLIISTVNTNATIQEDYKTIDLTMDNDPLHVILDVFDYNNSGLFCRLSRQRPKSTFIQRDYNTLVPGEILPGSNQNDQGIEQYTYGYLNYSTGIFSIAVALGAPRERAFTCLFAKYCRDYYIKLVSIPNANSIEKIYIGQNSEVSKITIEVPVPDAGILRQLFGWSNQEILEIIESRAASVAIEIKSPERQHITSNTDDSQKLIDTIRENIRRYQKAKIKAKTKDVRAQEYNFFDEYFSYPIDVSSYHMDNYQRVYYSVAELVELYKQNIINAFSENRAIFEVITGRR